MAKERFYKISAVFLLFVVILLAGIIIRGAYNSETGDAVKRFFTNKISVPYYDRVNNIIKNLQYSGLEAFKRPDVYLSLDFTNRTWRLHNIHKFDTKGDIILEKNRYGTCGELSSYVYNRIKEFMADDYDISFIRTAQSGYFLADNKSSHTVLRITPKPSAYHG